MPTLPVTTVTRPAVLAGKRNGELPASILVDSPGLARGPLVRLVAPAARAWRAMVAVAQRDGHVLKAVSVPDSYRDYATQRHIFTARYTRTFLENRPIKRWDSDNNGVLENWYQRPGTAQAAVPGTSNHGWGLAVDIGEERDGDDGVESIDDGTVRWLIVNAHRFGFSGEIQDEPWHWRYFAGDNIPAAVLAFEQGDDDVSDAYDLLVTGLRPGAPSQTHTPEPGRYDSIPNSAVLDKIWRASIDARIAADGVIALKSVVEQLADIIRQGGGTVDTVGILRGVDERLAAQRSAIEADTRDAVADLAEGGAGAVRADN